MLPTFRPDIARWSFWSPRGWIGEFESPKAALAMRYGKCFVCQNTLPGSGLSLLNDDHNPCPTLITRGAQ